MQFKKTLVWSLITGQVHPSLDERERTIDGVVPLVQTLFPGANYYSITGFSQILQACVTPALKKLFPELGSLSADDVMIGDAVEVVPFLASQGYEWQDSPEWADKFDMLMAA